MAAPIMNDERITKSERKLRKKLTKAQNTLFKHDGIIVSPTPTKILCVNNAGLVVGVSKEEVENIFSCYGTVAETIMLPQKPYAFVCFENENEATKACSVLNGTEIAPSTVRKNPVTMYISYVGEVPPCLRPSDEFPPGLVLLENFISQDEENQILKMIDWEECSDSAQQRELKHRQVKHYGFEFKYGINDVDADDPLPQGIPSECDELIRRALHTGHVHHYPDQLTVNKYRAGQGIPPHVDTPAAFEDGIMSLSLGSQVLMDFRHPVGKHLSVLLPPRSLLIMTDESRYVWSHGITPRKSDIIPTPTGPTLKSRGTRISLTFRKIIHPKERVKRRVPFVDDQETTGKQSVPKSDIEAARLECLHVHEVYEEIADHFSGTRHSPWPRIAEFIRGQPDGSLLADIGCGNGKYLGINPSIFEVGSDRSTNLARICRERNHQVFVSDLMSIPLRSDSFDVCLCIAVLHHLSTEERRLHGLSELVRILRPGGQALVYVWAMEQELHKVKSKYLREVKVKHSESENVHEATMKQEDCNKHTFDDNKIIKQVFNSREDFEKTDNNSVMKEFSEKDSENKEIERLISESSKLCDADSRDVDTDRLVNSTEDTVTSNEHITLQVHKNRTKFKQQDMLVPWQLKQKARIEAGASSVSDTLASDVVFHRYYHVFHQGELEALCGRLHNCKVVGGYYDQGNWAVIIQKLKLV